MEADLGRGVEILVAEVRRREEPRVHKKNIIEYMPYARYYAMHFMYILSGPHL